MKRKAQPIGKVNPKHIKILSAAMYVPSSLPPVFAPPPLQPPLVLPQFSVGVMDVGAGLSVLLYDHLGNPRVYFDVGKPLPVYTPTKPPNLQCCTKDTIQHVVITHWHYDHWMLANQFNLPQQAMHAHWYYSSYGISQLVHNFLLNIDPMNRHELQAGAQAVNIALNLSAAGPATVNITLRRMNNIQGTPASQLMNNLGVVADLNFMDSAGNPVRRIILPGDCSFESMSHNMQAQVCHATTAVHHGSGHAYAGGAQNWRYPGQANNLPHPPLGYNGKIVYSYGIKKAGGNAGRNAYDHPEQPAIDAYNANNFRVNPVQAPITTGTATAEAHVRSGPLAARPVPVDNGNILMDNNGVLNPNCGACPNNAACTFHVFARTINL